MNLSIKTVKKGQKESCKPICPNQFYDLAVSSGFANRGWLLLLEPLIIKKIEMQLLTKELSRCWELIENINKKVIGNSVNQAIFAGVDSDIIYDIGNLLDEVDGSLEPRRWDIVPTCDGPKVIEVNYGLSLGGINMNDLQLLLDKHLTCSTWTNPIAILIKELREHEFQHGKQQWLLTDVEDYYNKYYFFVSSFKELLIENGFDVVSAPASRIQHYISKGYLIVELFSALEISMNDIQGFYSNRNICKHLICNPGKVIYSSKVQFALLWESIDNGMLEPFDEELIRRLIPETKVLSTTIKDELLNSRLSWVIKPALGFGGENITIGKYTTSIQWECIINDILSDKRVYIAQRFVTPQRKKVKIIDANYNIQERLYPLILGVFEFNFTYSGTMIRVGTVNGRQINVSQGAAIGVAREI